MAEKSKAEQLIELLQNGESILCGVCKKDCYDVSGDERIRSASNYFHCSNPDCTGSVHIQKRINVE